MRRAFLLVGIATALLAPASAHGADELTVTAKITSFSVEQGGLVANGTVTGALRSGDDVARVMNDSGL